MRQGVKIIMILAIISAGFFYGQIILAAADHLVINEIQAYGDSASDDWIELYNPTNESIDLAIKGYRIEKAVTKTIYLVMRLGNISDGSYPGGTIIPAKGFYLIVRDDANDVLKNKADAIGISSNFTWTGTGYTLYLGTGAISSNADSDIIDKVGFGSATYYEGSNSASEISNNKSIERQLIGQDTDNNSADFFIQENPNPKNSTTPLNPPLSGGIENQAVNSTPASTSNDNVASSTSLAENPPTPLSEGGQKNNFGEVVINEFVSDPADNEVEWIELYNKADREIDLIGWRIEEGSKAKTNLSGVLAVTGAGRYKVIDKPAGSLNNNGDVIILYDGSGKIIDQLVYGNWDDSNPTDNAPAASDPNSLARKFDGYNTYNNLNDFAVTLKPTKGASNIIQIEDEVSAAAKAKFDFSSDIFISEILPNPIGDDTKLEFIEIYNAGQREVNLTGWSLSNEDGKKKNLENMATSTKIQAGEYLALYRPKTKIVLPNDQGQVKLFQPLTDKPFMAVDYKNVKEGWSYNNANFANENAKAANIRNVDEWLWSEAVTPGLANIIKAVNHAPEVEFSFKSPALINAPVKFDSSDSSDADDDELKYNWDFGDGFKNNLASPEHTYLKVGIYKVKLAVSDGKETGVKEKSVRVVNNAGELDVNVETPLTPLLKGGESGVIINEIFPNPKGADTGSEWLELKNQSSNKVNFINWRLENSNGKYEFKSEQLLAGGAFYVLDNVKSKLTFKNSSDVINLYNDLNELVDEIEYTGAVQGESYAKGANGNWFWTTAATPGAENVIKVADSKSGIMNNELGIMGKADGYIETTLEKVRELDIGSLVIVKGTVAVEPGILGAQIFYIVGSPGLQIYNYKKDFPALKIGDYIEVTGELTQTQGEFRIKTKDKSGIKINEHKPAPAALAMSADAVSEENVGQLITVSGEITDKKSSTLYLDDGSDEVLVYIKKNTGISTKGLTAGQNVAVSGILSKTKTGLRLLPRYQADIVLINSASKLEPQVLGEVASAREWNLTERDKKLELLKYLLIIASGVIIVLAGLFIKAKRKTK